MIAPLEELKVSATEKARDFPATTLRAVLKQVNVPALDERQYQAVADCFPFFANDTSEWNKSIEKESSEKKESSEEKSSSEARNRLWITSAGMYDTSEGRYRRYAGRRDLPGGRYFSVCQDEHGNDGGTLCYELMSYWNCTTGFYVGLTDSTVHRAEIEASPVAQLFEALHPILLVLAWRIDETRISKTGDAVPTGRKYPVTLPLRLVRMTCENVLDLRLPAAQDWLAAQSSVSGSSTSFGALLPNLLSPLPGGNEYHRRVGAWLRCHGCQGLVFPSARRDIVVEATTEVVIVSDGWSFVSYHGAQTTDYPHNRIGAPFPWLTSGKIGVDVYTTEGRLRCWAVKGAEAGEWGRIYYEVRRSRGQAPAPGATFDPYYDGRAMRRAGHPFFSPLEPDE